jgi:hypothetical protein
LTTCVALSPNTAPYIVVCGDDLRLHLFNNQRRGFLRHVVGTVDVFRHVDGMQVAVRNVHPGMLKYASERSSVLLLGLHNAILKLAHEVAHLSPSSTPVLALS